ncbi:MAG: hypothetical protein SPF70_03690 [Lachnospiraceae bacterium]|nr:hypothetical protein [Lachnospiraceae bacterium]
MEKLIEIREVIKQLYSRYAVIVEAVEKFLLSLIAILLINSQMGAMSILKNPIAVLGISIVCAAVPKTLMVVILALCIVAHAYALSMEMAALILVVLFIMFLFYFRFASGDGIVLILLPILFMLKIPFVMPIALGLLASPFSVVSMAFGTMMYFMIHYIHVNYESIVSASSSEGLSIMSDMAREVFSDSSMYLIIITFAVVLVAVWVIRNLSVRDSWLIAIGAGSVVDLVVMLIGSISFGVDSVLSVPAVILGNVASLLISGIIVFLFHHVDYSRTEHVQFEDDDYYYYVKAVPKVKTVKKTRRKKH